MSPSLLSEIVAKLDAELSGGIGLIGVSFGETLYREMWQRKLIRLTAFEVDPKLFIAYKGHFAFCNLDLPQDGFVVGLSGFYVDGPQGDQV